MDPVDLDPLDPDSDPDPQHWKYWTFCQMIKADLFQNIIERKEPTWRISFQVKKHFWTIRTKILGDQPSSDATSRGG